MALPAEIVNLVVRQADGGNSTDDLYGTPGHCDPSNEYDGRMGLRISAIFVILLGSLLGKSVPSHAS